MMGAFLLGLVLGGNLAWIAIALRRDSYWHEFNARRRGSNPPPPGRKPVPPAGPAPYGWGPGQLNPPPPAPGMRREYIWSPSQMAECGGPCWEAQDPRRCDCGALWRDVPTTPTKPEPTGGRLLKSWEEPSPPSEP